MTQADEDRPIAAPEGRRTASEPPASTARDAPDEGEAADPPQPSADIQSYIGTHLRAFYDDVASQPVPDRFLDLMKRLG